MTLFASTVYFSYRDDLFHVFIFSPQFSYQFSCTSIIKNQFLTYPDNIVREMADIFRIILGISQNHLLHRTSNPSLRFLHASFTYVPKPDR